MLVRHADQPRDARACALIYAPFVLGSVISFEEVAPSEREFARRIEQVSASYPWLVAEEHGEVIGYAYASQHRERAAYRWAADVAIYVDRAHHRHGAGRALYEALFELLVAQGLHVACAGITLPNDASVGLHEALGFELVGIYRRIGWKAGAWRDVGWWQRQLISDGDARAPQEPGPPGRLDPNRRARH
jgi:phosphinothricin acetyltransferase